MFTGIKALVASDERWTRVNFSKNRLPS